MQNQYYEDKFQVYLDNNQRFIWDCIIMFYDIFHYTIQYFSGGPAKVPGLICALPRCSAVFAPQLKNKPNKQNVIRSLTSLMVIPV